MNSSSRNGAKVIWLAIHTTEGFMRVKDLRDWAAWPGSSHASSDETGALWGPEQGFVPYDRMAWTLRNGNPISENIEQCGWARWSRAEWLSRPKLLDATARWLAERSKARGIPLVHLSLADIKARKPGVLGHGDYTYATGDGTHTDPGPNYPWDVVIDLARAYANPTPAPTVQEDDMEYRELMYDTKFRNDRNYAQVIHNIEDQATAANTQLAGLTAAVATLASALAAGRDDLTADELKQAVRDALAESTVKVDVNVSGGASA